MPKGICPSCEQLVDITPDRVIEEGFSARLQRVANHEKIDITSDPVVNATRKLPNMIIVVERCEGSGRLI